MVRKFFIANVLVVLLITFSILGCGSKNAIPEGTILAEFDYNGTKQFVTLEELENEIQELPKYKKSKYQDLEGKKEYITLMIESRLVLEIAKDEGLDKDPEILKKVEDQFNELMIEKLTETEVDNKVQVTEEDLKKYYDEHKEDYVEAEQVKMACISVDKKELAEEAFKQITEEGKDILEVAKALSDDRRLVGPGENARNPGIVEFSRNVPEPWQPFAEASFDELEVGEMYPKILEVDAEDTKYYLIFRKEEHQPERQKEFDEVRERVKRKVEKQKKEERMEEWVSQLRDKAGLKVYYDRIPVPSEEVSEEKTEEMSTEDVKEKGEQIEPVEENTSKEESGETQEE